MDALWHRRVRGCSKPLAGIARAQSRKVRSIATAYSTVFAGLRDKQRNLEHVSDSKKRERALGRWFSARAAFVQRMCLVGLVAA